MARTISHLLFYRQFSELNIRGRFARQSVKVKINRVGKLDISVVATVLNGPPPDPPQKPPNNYNPDNDWFDSAFEGSYELHSFNWELYDPDGNRFTKNTITMADLDRYRDLRGFIPEWTLVIPAATVPLTNQQSIKYHIQIATLKVDEILASSSASPLINTSVVISPKQEYSFDLYRLGRLDVRATPDSSSSLFSINLPITNVKISLVAPDGRTIASGPFGKLSVQITMKELSLSRGPDGVIRKWKLCFESTSKKKHRIFAQVYDTLRITKSVLEDRIKAILGSDGMNIVLGAGWDEARNTNRFTLTLKNDYVAETFDFHDLLSGLDKELNNKLNLDKPEKNVPYTLLADPLKLKEGFFAAQAICKNLESNQLKIEMGESRQERRALKRETKHTSNNQSYEVLDDTGEILLPKGLPTFSLSFSMTGSIHVNVDHYDDGDIVVPNFLLEIGLGVKGDGRLTANCWVSPDSAKWSNKPHHPDNDDWILKEGVADLAYKLDFLTDAIEGIVDRLMGGVFQFTSARWVNNSMEFEYIAGVEQERRPRKGYLPRGLSDTLPSGGAIPPQLIRDTWVSPNLSKIDHIIVLMMENRSFDHVLGYLSLPLLPSANIKGDVLNPAILESGVNGITDKLITEYLKKGMPIRPLREAGFKSNTAGLKTRIPLGVGHSFEDVEQQLEYENGTPTMNGFTKNFKAKHTEAELKSNGCKPEDVLGYYTDKDLAMYGYLAKEFAICDNYFCSHPGPTLPNRMFSLTGDFQYDRNGEPRINNGLDDSFFLSRDQTIFDILTQYGISWRVYEHSPSVTMLRFFTRYFGDNTNILDIENLEKDIKKGLPSVTFIDPRMHDFPPNDDHPPADMLNGQYLIDRVYRALRSNDQVWKKTLFIITYDEHGGLFDHAIPPIAEIFRDPQGMLPKRSASTKPGSGKKSGHKPDEKVIYGVRVPTFLVSPWVEKGDVCKTLTDHTSILKTILIRFCGKERPFLSDRVHHAYDLGAALTLATPRDIQTSPPNLPKLRASKGKRKERPIIRKSQITGENADFHEIMAVLSRMVKP